MALVLYDFYFNLGSFFLVAYNVQTIYLIKKNKNIRKPHNFCLCVLFCTGASLEHEVGKNSSNTAAFMRLRQSGARITALMRLFSLLYNGHMSPSFSLTAVALPFSAPFFPIPSIPKTVSVLSLAFHGVLLLPGCHRGSPELPSPLLCPPPNPSPEILDLQPESTLLCRVERKIRLGRRSSSWRGQSRRRRPFESPRLLRESSGMQS